MYSIEEKLKPKEGYELIKSWTSIIIIMWRLIHRSSELDHARLVGTSRAGAFQFREVYCQGRGMGPPVGGSSMAGLAEPFCAIVNLKRFLRIQLKFNICSLLLKKSFFCNCIYLFFIKELKRYNILTINLTCILIITGGSQNLFRRLN